MEEGFDDVPDEWFEEGPDEEIHESLPETIGRYAAEAIETVSIGEVLRDNEWNEASIEERVKKTISLRNSKAAIQRHSQVNKPASCINYLPGSDFTL